MIRMTRHVALALIVAGAAALAGPAQAQITFIPGQKDGEVATNRLGWTTVLNGKGDVIGRIEDIVLDARGQAVAVAVGVGGFLGVGQKIVAVPYNAIQIGPIVNGRRLVVLDVTKDQLAAAPAYKTTEPGKAERAKQTAQNWANTAKDKAIEFANQARDAAQKAMKDTPKPAEPAKK